MSGPNNRPITDITLDDVPPLSSQAIGLQGLQGTSVDAVAPPPEEIIRPVPRFRSLRRLFHNPKFIAGFVLVAFIVALSLLAPLIARYDPNLPNYGSLNQNPGPAHLLGTDYLGRDLWARLVWGGRLSLSTGILVVLVSLCAGVPWGIISGFGGRVIDDLLMRLIDVLLAFPFLVLAFTFITILGSGQRSVVISLGIAGIPGYARVARATTLTTKGLDYVMAARAQGAGNLFIMRRHVLRNIIDPLVILATLNLSFSVLAAAALSFLGIGTQPPSSDWGTMLANGYNYMFLSWSQVTFPAVIIVVWILGVNLMGDALGETLNPRLHGR